MHGFAGILDLRGAPLDARADALLDAMGAAIAHRGLDARRVLRDGPFGLVCPARAPAHVTAALDGRGDVAELAAHDVDRLSELVDAREGPFAFALWSRDRQRLVLARDRLGLRPLFVARVEGDTLLFGSEIKALLAHPACPREVDWVAALDAQARPQSPSAHRTAFRGVDPLRAGSMLVADLRRREVETRRWYTPPDLDAAPDDARTDAALIDGYCAALERAVDEALGADVGRAGLLLSGGIDSVSIAALAARRGPLASFTVLGQSTLGNGDAALAHRAAEALGLREHQVVFRVDEPITPDAWRRLLWLTETPACAYQHYYKFHLHRCAREAEPGLRLMLHGEGSDELSGADFRNQGDDAPDATFDDYLAAVASRQREGWLDHEPLAVEAWMGRPVFARDFLVARSGRTAPSPWARRVAVCLDALEGDVLWREDRIAAGCGLDTDAPFVHRGLVEYVLRIPRRAHASLFWRKRMLREAMRGVVPDALRDAPKIPFFGGVDAHYSARLVYGALMADDRALVREALGDGGPHPALADGLVDALLDDLARDPHRVATQLLLTLTNLGLLERMARDAAARPGPALAVPALATLDVPWEETVVAARLATPRAAHDLDVAWALAPGVELARPEGPDAPDALWIVVSDVVRYVLDGDDTRAWREVLRRVDGVRTLRSIFDELSLDLDGVRRHLDEAVDFGVLGPA